MRRKNFRCRLECDRGIKKTAVPSYLLQIKNRAESYEVAVECKDLAYDRMYEVACGAV